jgi:hypothetical protein
MTDRITESMARPLIEIQMEEAGREIEKLMDVYPCLREVCRGLKVGAYPAALFTSATFLGTLMTRCTYRYYGKRGQLCRLNYGTYVIGDPGTGKSFVTLLYNLLAGPIIKESDKGRKDMNNYRRRYKRWDDNGRKGDGPQKPKPLIRTHPARTSNKVFIEDMINAVDIVDGEPMHLHQLSFDTELDNAIRMQGEHWNDKRFLEMKSFHNEEDGMFYSNIDSVCETFNVFWNYVYTGTPFALRHKVNGANINDGLSTRLAVIPMPPSNFKMLERETLDDDLKEPEEYKTLRMWAERLDKTHGELPVKELEEECYDWTKDRMEDAEYDNSKSDELMCKRVGYYGMNVSIPFVIMRHWDEWQEHGTISIDKTDRWFCRLIMQIQFACQRHYFGRFWDVYYEHEHDQFSVVKKNVRHSHLTKERFALLPEVFTKADMVNILKVTQSNADKMVTRWQQEGYLKPKGNTVYEKVLLDLY